MKVKLIPSIFLLVIMSAANAYAKTEPSWAIHVSPTFAVSLSKQQPQSQTTNQDSELVTQEKMVAELRKLRELTESLKAQTDLLTQTLDVYKKIDDARTIQINILRSALDDREKYDILSQKKEELYKQEIDLLKAEINRLKAEVAAEKRSKLLNKVGSALLTIGVVFAATR